MRGVLLASLLVAAFLAGCGAAGEPEEVSSSASATSSTIASNVTAAKGPALAAKAPAFRANLTADVVNGSAPLRVNFTLSSGAGPTNLTWTLVTALIPRSNATAGANTTANATTPANGTAALDPSAFGNLTAIANGTALPATVNHTFEEGGSWMVLLSVRSGQANATATVGIEVAGGNATAERIPLVLAEYSNTGLIGGPYALTNDPMMAHQCPGFNLGEDGLGCVFLEFSGVGAHDGLPGILTTDAANFRLAFWDECSPLGSGVGFASGATGGRFEIPVGAGCGVVWSSNTGDWGKDRTFTLTVYDWLPEPEE